MEPLEFIKKFSKINITDICRYLKIDRSNLLRGLSSKENEKKVKNEIILRMFQLFLEEEEKNEKINTL